MPVFNRLEYTKIALKCIQNQLINEELCTIIIDDGSTDGTSEYLQNDPSVNLLQGDGSLWWAGSIELGLKYVLTRAGINDWVLLLNNDVEFGPDFIRLLLDTAVSCKPAVVGSVICDINQPDLVISIGPEINPWSLRIRDKLKKYRNHNPEIDYHHVSALSGRGTLYPLEVFEICGTMRPSQLPHYFADYEMSIRAKKSGYKLLTSERAPILSLDDYGNSNYFPLSTRFVSKKSSSYIPALFYFWLATCTNFFQIITLLPRLFLFKVIRFFETNENRHH